MKVIKNLEYILKKKWKEVVAFAVAAMILTTSVITVSTVANYKILDGESEKTLVTVKKEAEKVLNEAGVEKLKEGDIISEYKSKPQEITIEVKRAFDVEVIINGESKTYKSTKKLPPPVSPAIASPYPGI